MTSSTTRRLCFGALAATAALAISVPAHAASDEIAYTCTLYALPFGIEVDELDTEEQELLRSATEGEVAPEALAEEIPEFVEIEGLTATASFDSVIKDGATAAAGTRVELSPVAGAVTLGADVTDELVALGITEGEAGALLFAGIEETGVESDTEFYFDSVSVPKSGAFTLKDSDGFAESFRVNAPGTFTYTAGDLSVYISTGDEESGSFAALECVADDDQELAIDQVTVKAAATPTPTTPGPVRPDVVQTDAAQPTAPSWLPLAAAGTGSILVLGASSALLRRRGARR